MIAELFNNEGGFVVTLLIGRIGLALLYIVMAIVASWLVPPLVQRSVLAWAEMQSGGEMSARRHNTIARLMRYLTRAAIFSIAAIAVLSLFVDSAGLFTFLGLFTAAMGFALRQTIGDYISGFIFLFENLFAIGDDVEVGGERGIVEDVSMRTTLLRAPTGEERIVPNGDIRTVYNYTRAVPGPVAIHVRVPAAQIKTVLETLNTLTLRLPDQIPELLDTPQVQVEDGALGSNVDVVMRATARIEDHDTARRQMLLSIQEALLDENIDLAE